MDNLTVITDTPQASLKDALEVMASPIKAIAQFQYILSHSGKATTTKAQYLKAFVRALEGGVNLGDIKSVTTYATGLKSSPKAFFKASLKLYCEGLMLEAKANATPELLTLIQTMAYRFEAMGKAIKVEGQKGVKGHVWLSLSQVVSLLQACDTSTLKGKRDKMALSLLLGCGLRRDEATNVKYSDMVKEGGRWVINVKGKGAKGRVMPLSDTLVTLIQRWRKITGDGFVLRSITKGGVIKKSLSNMALFNITKSYGEMINTPELAPHDLRRSYAQLGLEGGYPIHKISVLLGHSSIETTRLYLNITTDLKNTICDIIPLSL